MSKLESKKTGTVSPKQKRVRSKSVSSGERCTTDHSDSDMDTSVTVRSDQQQAAAAAVSMLVDVAHLETAQQLPAPGK